jgi:hypothetical protein
MRAEPQAGLELSLNVDTAALVEALEEIREVLCMILDMLGIDEVL